MSEEMVRHALRELPPEPAALPDPKRIWWLAESRRRQEAHQRVSRIMDTVRIATSAAALLGAGGLAVWSGTDLPGIAFLTVAAVICALAAGLRAVLARE